MTKLEQLRSHLQDIGMRHVQMGRDLFRIATELGHLEEKKPVGPKRGRKPKEIDEKPITETDVEEFFS